LPKRPKNYLNAKKRPFGVFGVYGVFKTPKKVHPFLEGRFPVFFLAYTSAPGGAFGNDNSKLLTNAWGNFGDGFGAVFSGFGDIVGRFFQSIQGSGSKKPSGRLKRPPKPAILGGGARKTHIFANKKLPEIRYAGLVGSQFSPHYPREALIVSLSESQLDSEQPAS
jgi:hypothetical protein